MTKFILPTLKYGFKDLEPYIDALTVEIHYSKHHQTYLDKLTAALDKYPEIPDKSILDILRNLNEIPEDIRTAVKNMGGCYYNHNLYWATMTPGGAKSPEFEAEIMNNFGSWNDFKTEFVIKATTLFGSGWVWLTKNNVGKLEIIQMPNQDIPEGKHLVAINVWEHAYYLKYQNKRPEYIEAWWNLVDWVEVYKNLNA